ncbi:MAG: hypothetical protein ACYS74_00855 [Planctomycetota bacterium]
MLSEIEDAVSDFAAWLYRKEWSLMDIGLLFAAVVVVVAIVGVGNWTARRPEEKGNKQLSRKHIFCTVGLCLLLLAIFCVWFSGVIPLLHGLVK